MKKLIFGITLLTSISAFSNQVPSDCSVVLFGTDHPISLEGHDNILKEKFDIVENNARFYMRLNGICDEGVFLDECHVTVEIVNKTDRTVWDEATGYSDFSYSKGVEKALRNLGSCK